MRVCVLLRQYRGLLSATWRTYHDEETTPRESGWAAAQSRSIHAAAWLGSWLRRDWGAGTWELLHEAGTPPDEGCGVRGRGTLLRVAEYLKALGGGVEVQVTLNQVDRSGRVAQSQSYTYRAEEAKP